MGTIFSSISNVYAKEILSKFFGDTKRIPFGCITMTVTDGLATQIDAHWPITEDDVKDHVGGILQGVMIQEAASQAVVCYVVAMDLFPNHSPAFLGSDYFRIRAPVYAGENLHIKITSIAWRGKMGYASAIAFKNEQRVATIGRMLFLANENHSVPQMVKVA